MERLWIIGNPNDDQPVDRESVVELLEQMEVVGNLVGGAFTLVPARRFNEQLGAHVTVAWVAKWDSFAPALATDSGPALDGAPEPIEPIEPIEPEVEHDEPKVEGSD